MSQPLVTVLLPAYNAQDFITEALDSIVHQSYTNLEILVINDGSTDNTNQVISGYSDERIRLIQNEENLGLIKTLNKGIGLASGKYIARMDADDYSYPERIQLQVDYLEQNPTVGIVGTWFETYINNEFHSSVEYNTDNNSIKLHQFFQIHLCHGTALFRTRVLTENALEFNINYKHAEDYELWSRLKHHCEMANIPKVLYRVNQHGENVSLKNSDTQIENTFKVTQKQVEELIGKTIDQVTLQAFVKLCYSDFSLNAEQLDKVGALITEFIDAPSERKLIEKETFDQFWKDKWNNQCLNQTKLGKATITAWKKYPQIAHKELGTKLKIKSLLKR